MVANTTLFTGIPYSFRNVSNESCILQQLSLSSNSEIGQWSWKRPQYAHISHEENSNKQRDQKPPSSTTAPFPFMGDESSK